MRLLMIQGGLSNSKFHYLNKFTAKNKMTRLQGVYTGEMGSAYGPYYSQFVPQHQGPNPDTSSHSGVELAQIVELDYWWKRQIIYDHSNTIYTNNFIIYTLLTIIAKLFSHQLVLFATMVRDESRSFAFEGLKMGWLGLAGVRVTNSLRPYQRTRQWARAGKSFSLFIRSSKAWGSLSVSSSFSYSGKDHKR